MRLRKKASRDVPPSDNLKEMFRGDTGTFEVYLHHEHRIHASTMVFDIEIQILFQLALYSSPIGCYIW